jgi:hypothetical protein
MLAENIRTRNSLNHFKQGLDEPDLLLSFYLGNQESYFGAVRPAGDILGADLYQRLFDLLDLADAAKRSRLSTPGVAPQIQNPKKTVPGAAGCTTVGGNTCVGAGLLGFTRARMMARSQVTGGGR